jgi:hypothetical protein
MPRTLADVERVPMPGRAWIAGSSTLSDLGQCAADPEDRGNSSANVRTMRV